MQYFSLVNELDAYERENYDKFLARGTKVVNTILKRNVIKLEPCHSVAGNKIYDYYQFDALNYDARIHIFGNIN